MSNYEFSERIEFMRMSADDATVAAWWHVVALRGAAYGESWILAEFADQQPLLALLMARAHAAIVLDEFLAANARQ